MTTHSEHVDAAVIGSGFGGAVAAARLAQAGLDVVVLERGRRWQPGDFPRDDTSIDHDWLWSKDRGLYDIRWLDTMVGVQAAGWGGGSLVYANVFARPPREAFEHWPVGLDRHHLDPYYDLAAHMLRVAPVGRDPLTGDVPARTIAMERAAGRMHRPTGTVRPLLAVTFADGTEAAGHGGTCTFTGECMFGCNEGAKNSVDRNYLAVAERLGARARTLCEVDRITPTADGYLVEYLDHGAQTRVRLHATRVFLAAGAVGTTELLLRNRDIHHTLPRVSPALGRGFSGNGDFLAFVSRPRTQLEPGRGPTITTTTIVDCHVGDQRVWFQVQDGAYPTQIAGLVRSVNPLRRQTPRPPRHPERTRRRDQTMSLLMMGRDSSDGLLTLDHNGEARVAWRTRANSPLYRAEMRAARQAARQLGGRVRFFPSWVFLRTGVTVHNLGGAPMSTDAAHGVIDEFGQVHGHPGLYVVDGAAVPASTGVNPSATIAALAERNVEAAIREILHEPGWAAPESGAVRAAPVPEDEAMRAVQSWREVHGRGYDPTPRPVHFRETMIGAAALVDSVGAIRTERLRLQLSVEIPDGELPHGDAAAPAQITGVARFGATTVQVTGTLELFPDEAATFMRYRLRYTDGRRCHGELTGAKTHTRGRLPRLGELLAMPVAIVHHQAGETLHGNGVVRISPLALPPMLISVRGGGDGAPAAVASVARFVRRFVIALFRRAAEVPASHEPLRIGA